MATALAAYAPTAVAEDGAGVCAQVMEELGAVKEGIAEATALATHLEDLKLSLEILELEVHLCLLPLPKSQRERSDERVLEERAREVIAREARRRLLASSWAGLHLLHQSWESHKQM